MIIMIMARAVRKLSRLNLSSCKKFKDEKIGLMYHDDFKTDFDFDFNLSASISKILKQEL